MDVKNSNWSISLWEEPVKGRACNHGTPLVRRFGEQVLHSESVTWLKKAKKQTSKQTCASCNVGESLSGEVLGRQPSQFKSFLLSRGKDLTASLSQLWWLALSVVQWRLLYQLKTIYFFSL